MELETVKFPGMSAYHQKWDAFIWVAGISRDKLRLTGLDPEQRAQRGWQSISDPGCPLDLVNVNGVNYRFTMVMARVTEDTPPKGAPNLTPDKSWYVDYYSLRRGDGSQKDPTDAAVKMVRAGITPWFGQWIKSRLAQGLLAGAEMGAFSNRINSATAEMQAAHKAYVEATQNLDVLVEERQAFMAEVPADIKEAAGKLRYYGRP